MATSSESALWWKAEACRAVDSSSLPRDQGCNLGHDNPLLGKNIDTARLPPLALLAGAIIAALAASGAVRAATIEVGMDCTLSQAITSANEAGGDVASCAQGSGADTIKLPANLDLTLTDELPTITSDIAFEGDAAQPATIAGDGSHRLFLVDNQATVSFSDLTLTGGKAHGGDATGGAGGGTGLGGAIFILDGHVSTHLVSFVSNTATGGAASGQPAPPTTTMPMSSAPTVLVSLWVAANGFLPMTSTRHEAALRWLTASAGLIQAPA